MDSIRHTISTSDIVTEILHENTLKIDKSLAIRLLALYTHKKAQHLLEGDIISEYYLGKTEISLRRVNTKNMSEPSLSAKGVIRLSPDNYYKIIDKAKNNEEFCSKISSRNTNLKKGSI
jgi:hypothetical protein